MKLNYTKLCDSFPQDYMRTIQVLMECLETPDEAMHQLTMMQSVELVNENIVGNLMLGILQSDKDILKFCNIVERVLNTTKGKNFIHALRNRKFKYHSNIIILSTIILYTINSIHDRICQKVPCSCTI